MFSHGNMSFFLTDDTGAPANCVNIVVSVEYENALHPFSERKMQNQQFVIFIFGSGLQGYTYLCSIFFLIMWLCGLKSEKVGDNKWKILSCESNLPLIVPKLLFAFSYELPQ